ncbi:MAG: MFS transporter [Rhodocyclaceae bacterium]|nr:MFS transporter [Rhodocyclaceae bacterium]MBX3670286.1 MFS transporter [Rhodocyclaceae bacterium]
MTAATLSTPRREFEVIALIGLVHGTSHFFHLLLPPLFPWLMREFGLSFAQAGALMSMFFVVSGSGQALAGFVVDRFGAYRVLCAGISLFAAAALALAVAHSYAALFAVAVLAGLGNCVFHPADFTLLNRRVSKPRLGHAFSVHGLSGNLGWAAAPPFLVAAAAWGGWRFAAAAAAVVALAALALLAWRRTALIDAIEAADVAELRASATPAGPLAFLRVPVIWMCFGFFLLATVAISGLQNFGPSVLQALYGLSLALGTTALSVFLLAGAAGVFAGGFFVAGTERQDRVIALTLSGAAAIALLLASGSVANWSITPLIAVMGFCNGFANPSRDMLVRKAATGRFGQAAYGRIYGFVYSGLDLGFALAPLVFGHFMDDGHAGWVLAGAGCAQLAALSCALGIGARHARSAAAA